jgi:hypothetical protein
VNLDDLFCDGQPEPGAALSLGVRAVDLVELFEDFFLLLGGYPGTRVADAQGEVTILARRRDAHLARIGKLHGVADEIE